MPDFLETTIDKFIFRVATDRLYSSDGVWVLETGGGRVQVGVSDYVQQRNGDVAFVHTKPQGTLLARGVELVELETVKATMSVISPLAGAIVEVNGALDLSPENINQEPYGKGWLASIEATNWEADRAKLLDPQAYLSAMRSQAEEESKEQ
jgi:glycine cleavage system H protein